MTTPGNPTPPPMQDLPPQYNNNTTTTSSNSTRDEIVQGAAPPTAKAGHEQHSSTILDAKTSTGALDNDNDLEFGPRPRPVTPNTAVHGAGRLRLFLHRHKHATRLTLFALCTGWWVAGLVLHRRDKNWVVPFLVWLAVALRLGLCYLPARHVSAGISFVWKHTAVRVYDAVPERLRTPAGALATVAVVLVGGLATEESADNTRANRAVSLFGLAVCILALWLTSRDRRSINWRTVIVGMLMQYLVALFVLRTRVGYDVFKFVADRAGDLLRHARDGVEFLTTKPVSQLTWFLLSVIPAIIFFISLVQVLYHVGFLQWFIRKMAAFVFWALAVSGVEAVVAAATPFIGQGESAMLVRPFVPHMTRAELHQILTCGFATISGSVLVGYIALGLNAEVLVSSCIMSIPASLAISKMRYPETEQTLTAGRVVMPESDEDRPANALHAFALGAWLGIKIGATILASLLCVIAAVGLVNALLGWWGGYLNIADPDLSLQLLISFICYPIAFLLGVPRNGDLYKVARLIAEKIVTNEYNAFTLLTKDPWYNDLSTRSRLIATYALCGFGNIASLGVQLGILSQLAPSRVGDVAKLAVSALISGILSTLTSASVAGLVVTDQTTILSGSS